MSFAESNRVGGLTRRLDLTDSSELVRAPILVWPSAPTKKWKERSHIIILGWFTKSLYFSTFFYHN